MLFCENLSVKTVACLFLLLLAASDIHAFTASPLFGSRRAPSQSLVAIEAVQSTSKGQGYVPKWTKKSTLAEEQGTATDIGFENVGLKEKLPQSHWILLASPSTNHSSRG